MSRTRALFDLAQGSASDDAICAAGLSTESVFHEVLETKTGSRWGLPVRFQLQERTRIADLDLVILQDRHAHRTRDRLSVGQTQFKAANQVSLRKRHGLVGGHAGWEHR